MTKPNWLSICLSAMALIISIVQQGITNKQIEANVTKNVLDELTKNSN